ncbi:hypothetical protein [Caballeronia humi]|jgi:hypothetical protein|uniref:hypothetical protein n=1 Tax=Caballeronia humi TaxID=326474 RepID=UPI000F74826F|nr:hypothetical protein [Caballeronia humi]
MKRITAFRRYANLREASAIFLTRSYFPSRFARQEAMPKATNCAVPTRRFLIFIDVSALFLPSVDLRIAIAIAFWHEPTPAQSEGGQHMSTPSQALATAPWYCVRCAAKLSKGFALHRMTTIPARTNATISVI